MTCRFLYLVVIALLQIFIISPDVVKGQSSFRNNSNKNSLFVDVSSAGPVYSLNFDRIFSGKTSIKYSYRVGFHLLNSDVGLPVGLSMLAGSNNHHAELGLTFIPYIKRFKYLFNEGSLSDKQIFIIPSIGYRFQKAGGGVFFRILVSPMVFLDPPSDDFWDMEPKIYGMAGIGAGWTF